MAVERAEIGEKVADGQLFDESSNGTESNGSAGGGGLGGRGAGATPSDR